MSSVYVLWGDYRITVIVTGGDFDHSEFKYNWNSI